MREIDLGMIVRKLLSRWKTICLWAIVGLLFGYLIAKSIPKSYTVVTKVSPELSYRPASITSLAALAGVSTNMLNNTEAILPTVYPDIISSPAFLLELLDTKVHSSKADTTLYVYLRDYTKVPWWNAVISLPFKAISGIKSWFVSEKEESVPKQDTQLKDLEISQEEYGLIAQLNSMIDIEVDNRTFTISIEVASQDPVVSAQVSKALLLQLKKFVTDYRTEKARKDLEFFESLHLDAEAEYYQAQTKLSRYVDTHQGFVLQSALVEQQRLQNDVNHKFQIYSSLSQQLQNARAKVQQETPVFAELVPPVIPVRSSGPKTMRISLFFCLIAIVISCYCSYKK